jgi:hypothetical protein
MRVVLASVALGLAWGGATQWFLTTWRTLPILADNGWGTALLWLVGLLVLIAFTAPGRTPFVLGAVGACFWVSAVLGYYLYYIVQLALGLGLQGTSLDLGQPGSYRALWYLFKGSILAWLGLAAVGGFGLGWGWGQIRRRRTRLPLRTGQ